MRPATPHAEPIAFSEKDLAREEHYVESTQQVPGRRVVYTGTEEKVPMTHMQLFLVYDARNVEALCKAPQQQFVRYEPLFLALLADVRVLDTE